MNASLKGQKIVVTGASRGIGAAIALELAERGASIAIGYAAREEAAQKVLAAVQAKEPFAAQLRDVLLAQQELVGKNPGTHLGGLEARLPTLHPANRLLAQYWLGTWRATGDEAAQRDAALDFLTVAALAEDHDQELTAAGLYHAWQILDKLKDTAAAAVRQELLGRYRDTAQGKRAAELERS